MIMERFFKRQTEARCLGGPLDGHMKPIIGRYLEALYPIRQTFSWRALNEPPAHIFPSAARCIYRLIRSSQGEIFWICD